MIKVSIQGIDKALADLAGKQKQVRFATAVALTKTAKRAQVAVADEFKAKFDRPTRTTLKSMWVKPATKANLEAMVYVKDRPLGGKNPFSMADILKHQFTGGTRIAKQMELVLRNRGYLGQSEFVVPGAAAKLDANGNMSRGQIVQILSQIGVRVSGYDSTPTKSRRSRRNVALAGKIFWSYGKGSFPSGAFTGNINKIDWETGRYLGKTQHLPKGAWMRDGQSVKPLLIAIKGQRYRKRIDLDRIVRAQVDKHFTKEFDQAFAEAMRSAR